MELSNQKRLVNHIFRLLKVTEITIPIGRTNKGNLGLKFSQNSDDYEIMLDAVPLSTKDFLNDENNIELKKMLEKYLFVVEAQPHKLSEATKQTLVSIGAMAPTELLKVDMPKKQRGRPKGSKAKVK